MKKNVLGSMALLFGVLVGTAGCPAELGGIIGRMAFHGERYYAPAAPVPADARIIPPSADISDTISAFADAWSGVLDSDKKWWRPDEKGERRVHLLIVEEIISPEKAKVVFSNGESQTRVRWRPVRDEKWQRVVAKFQSDDVLVVKATGATAVYRLSADKKTLDAELTEPGMPTLRATLRRFDLAELKKEANAK